MRIRRAIGNALEEVLAAPAETEVDEAEDAEREHVEVRRLRHPWGLEMQRSFPLRLGWKWD
jgi:hypothetical protein